MDIITAAITALLAGGDAATFQAAVAAYSPAEINRVAGLLLAAATIDQAGFRTVLAAQVS